MDPVTTGLFSIVVLVSVILLFDIPVALAMGGVGFIFYIIVHGLDSAVSMLGNELWAAFSSYSLGVVPFFIFMGQVAFESGINDRLYRAVNAWIGHIRGGIAVATILTCAGFSAICGSNSATAATMSTVALPQMRRYKYHNILSTGAIAAGSSLGVIIPPSIILIAIGVQTSTSISKLFMASMLPGILLALLMTLVIFVVCFFKPEMGPAGDKATSEERRKTLPAFLEVLAIFLMVMGGLFCGVFTPTEAGSAGSVLVLAVAVIGRRITFRSVYRAAREATATASMVIMVIAGAMIYGKYLTSTRLPFVAAEWVGGLEMPPLVILFAICAIYLVGGMVMDGLALLLVSIPIFFPLLEVLGFDPLWFGIVVTIITTVGAISPPVGINCFVVAGQAPDVPLSEIYTGAMYFVASYFVCIALLILFPSLTSFLPSLM